jgi:hypothetical protein
VKIITLLAWRLPVLANNPFGALPQLFSLGPGLATASRPVIRESCALPETTI